MFLTFDPLYLLFTAPAMLLALWAQGRVQRGYAKASGVPARLSGRGAARLVLDSAGLQNVAIEPVRGELTDHYDPRAKVLRLSEGVYSQANLAAVGIAAHEAGHAIQDARHYAPLVFRNLAVPAASIGSGIGLAMVMFGVLMFQSVLGQALVSLGMLLYSGVVIFQLINLPVEFDASRRAKLQLQQHGIVAPQEMTYVSGVLNSAAWTYVAATLQAVMVLLYLFTRFGGSSDE